MRITRVDVGALLVGLGVAAVWGYFSDLRHGEVGWFIGRLAFVGLAVVVLGRLALWKKRP